MKMVYSVISKIFLIIIALGAGVFFLEMALRFTGHAAYKIPEWHFVKSHMEHPEYNSYQHFEHYMVKNPDKSKYIMILGDSFISADNLKTHENFPYFLFKMLEYKNYNYSVVNFARHHDSTKTALSRLVKNVSSMEKAGKKLPAMVIITIGGSDMYTRLLNTELTVSSTSSADTVNFNAYTRDWEPRILKFYRNFKEKPMDFKVTHSEKHLREMMKKIDNLKRKINGSGDLDDRYSTLKSVSEIVRIYTQSYRYSKAMVYLMKVMEDFPLQFWSREDLGILRYKLVQLFTLQNQYRQSDIVKRLKKIEKQNRYLGKNACFRKFKNLMKRWKKIVTKVDRERLKSWDHAIQFFKKKGVSVILMDYPQAKISANKMLYDVAKKYSLKFISNAKDFAFVSIGPQKAFYIYDEDYLTRTGHEKMAHTVFKEITPLLVK